MGVENLGHMATHWALGGLVLIAVAASEYSGAGTLVALPIAAVSVSLAALTDVTPKLSKSSTRRKSAQDVAEFLEIWFDILEHLVSAAMCARVTSTTVDYTTEGKLRDWLFGIDSHSLGEPWPDILGISIIAVVTAMFMLGLEKSYAFCALLFIGLLLSLTFFTIVGSLHADIIFWNWAEDFNMWSWGHVLTAAALCSFGFANSLTTCAFTTYKRTKIATAVIMPLLCYACVALVFTLMSHFREVAGTAIPLVRVFEVRDVDWARLVMAVCTICIVCLSLTEIMPQLYNQIVQLASFNWRILVSPILYKNSLTGAPVLAIFTAGSLCSILAFACPLWYLIRLVNTSALIKCALKAAISAYDQFKPEFANETALAQPSNVQYSQLNLPAKKLLSRSKSKSLYSIIPKYLRKTHENIASNVEGRQRKSRKSPSGDKEYLLLDQYSTNVKTDQFQLIDDSSSDNEVPETSRFSDGEDSGSSTDIDAVVQEYKERIQVATITRLESAQKCPTFLTSRIVLSFIVLLMITSALLSVGVILRMNHLIWPSLTISMLCMLVVASMPRKPAPSSDMAIGVIHPVVQPWLFLTAVFLNVVLATTLLFDIWPAIVLWILAGLVLFSRCSCCNCEEDRHHRIHRLYASGCGSTECSVTAGSRHQLVAGCSTSTISANGGGNNSSTIDAAALNMAATASSSSGRFVEVDTIIIPR